jgi:hypothetical protein
MNAERLFRHLKSKSGIKYFFVELVKVWIFKPSSAISSRDRLVAAYRSVAIL